MTNISKDDDNLHVAADDKSAISRRAFTVGAVSACTVTGIISTPSPVLSQGAADAARNATQSAVQSAIQSAREEVLTRLELRAGETKRAALISGTVRPTKPPNKGKLSVRKQGKQTAVYYKANKEASGDDSFQYIKVADAGSTETITVAVTIK